MNTQGQISLHLKCRLCLIHGLGNVRIYRGADKFLARPGGKQARKHVRDACNFNNIETRAVIKFFFFPARQGAKGNSGHSDRSISLFPSWSGYGLISTLYDDGSMSVTQNGTALMKPNIGSNFGHSISILRLPPEQRQKQTKNSCILHMLFFTTVTKLCKSLQF